MKIYKTPDGRYHGRRETAGKSAVIVEYPTKAEEAANFLNQIIADLEFEAAIGAPPAVVVEAQVEGKPLSYAEQSVGGDDWFLGIPVEHQLTLTQLAHENAVKEIARLKANQAGGMTKPAPTPEPVEEDDPFA